MRIDSNQPLFTIITAAYNVADYIEETIKSVLKQSIGKQNIQYILVDDGSTDDTGKICDKYAKKYPEIITVIHQKNAGVSAARNAGLKLAKGKYINFIDGDDKFSKNTLKKVRKFLEKYGGKVDVVSLPLIFFDDENGPHALNHKFEKGSRIIDLNKEYDNIQLHVCSVFINSNSLKNRWFDNKLKYAEDANFLLPILMKKNKLGVVANTVYWYRKRKNSSSAIQSAALNPSWYFPYLNYFTENTLHHCKNKNGKVPKFVQYTLAYDLQWRVGQNNFPPDVLSRADIKKFREQIFKIYDQIDDDIILEQKNMLVEPRFMILTKKHGHLPKMMQRKDGSVAYSYDGKLLYFDLAYVMVNLDFVKIYSDHITIEGWLPHNKYMEKTLPKLYLELNSKRYNPKLVSRQTINSDKSMGIPLYDRVGFYFDLPLADLQKTDITFFRESPFGPVVVKNLLFGKFCPVDEHFNNTHYNSNGWTIHYKNNSVQLQRKNRNSPFDEIKFLVELLRKRAWPTVALRTTYHIVKPFKHKPVWLVSDRPMKADDNGEAFFDYLQKKHDHKIKSYFVISKDSPDYKRIKKIGPVIKYLSIKHRLMLLLCDYNISSIADPKMMVPLGNSFAYNDILMNNKFVFLQHGIIKDDISSWLNVYNHNFYGFIVSANNEYKSIINTKSYHYPPERIWLTGLPRYDELKSRPEKLITIMPTWRRWLMGEYNEDVGIWSLSGDLTKTKYYKFYNNLINHKDLLVAAKKYGYKIKFMPHPTLLPFVNLFTKNNMVSFGNFNTKYRDLYTQSNLMLTDYSSAIFDFAYLKKPVIYSHFDKDEFFGGNHSYDKGYFDYERDGFGEVLYNLENTVNTLIEYMKNGCNMKPKYEKRVNDFFAFHDKKNCERIYNKLINEENKTT